MSTTEKCCIECGVSKPLTEFYAHPMMHDGHLGTCKECKKAASKARYRDKRDDVREYERKRQQTPERRASKYEYLCAARKRDPLRAKARAAVNNAIRDGKLVRQPCACGNPKSEGHHDDYSKPLEVRWECFRCHREHEHGQIVG